MSHTTESAHELADKLGLPKELADDLLRQKNLGITSIGESNAFEFMTGEHKFTEGEALSATKALFSVEKFVEAANYLIDRGLRLGDKDAAYALHYLDRCLTRAEDEAGVANDRTGGNLYEAVPGFSKEDARKNRADMNDKVFKAVGVSPPSDEKTTA